MMPWTAPTNGITTCQSVVLSPLGREPPEMEITTIGLDIAKNVFQVHGIEASGRAVIRRQLRRGQVLPFFEKQPCCLVGIEACATSHYWAREIAALGHDVRLMPPRYVKPYVTCAPLGL
jgi:transposase